MVVYYYISLFTLTGTLYISITVTSFFSPCHSFIGLHHLIDFLSRTEAILVTMPRSPAGSSISRCRCLASPRLASPRLASLRLAVEPFLRFHEGFRFRFRVSQKKRKTRDVNPRPRPHPQSKLTT